ncbi:MAG TPA: hypothetical protein VE032_10430 [Actinomycetota bacterium]|nr:hypothetical protein [Actinomycetota bacterium]
MSERPFLRRGAALGLAVGGVLLGHAITYEGLSPGAVAREAWLAATGHGYLGAANRLGMLAAFVTLGVLLLRRVVGPGAAHLSRRELVTRLIGFQLAAFLVLEVAERAGAGNGFHDLLTVLPVGLLIQAAIAAAIGIVVGGLLRAVDRLVDRSAGGAPSPSIAALAIALPVDPFHRAPRLAPLGGRAPPRSA